jgi:hypothetical protein
MPGQTIEDVGRAEAVFVEKVTVSLSPGRSEFQSKAS